MRYLRQIWIYIVGFVLWLNEEARESLKNVSQGVWTGAKEIFHRLGNVVQLICIYIILLGFIGFLLIGISLKEGQEYLRLPAIIIFFICAMALYFTMRAASEVVDTVFSEAEESILKRIKDALRTPFRPFGIVMTILACWGLAVIVWPKMPLYPIGIFTIVIIVGYISSNKVLGKPITLKIARWWFRVAVIIFIGEMVLGPLVFRGYISEGREWIKRQVQGYQLDQRMKQSVDGKKRTFLVSQYKRLHKQKTPIVYEYKKQNNNYQLTDIDPYNLNTNEYVISEKPVPQEIARKFGRLNVVFFESLPSRENPEIYRYIGPVDCFESVDRNYKDGGRPKKVKLPSHIIWPDGRKWKLEFEPDYTLQKDFAFVPKGRRMGGESDIFLRQGDIIKVSWVEEEPKTKSVAYLFDRKGYITKKWFPIGKPFRVEIPGWLIVVTKDHVDTTYYFKTKKIF